MILYPKYTRNFIFLLSFFLLSSCAPKMPTQVEINPIDNASIYEDAAKRWDTMKEYTFTISPMLVEGSLRFGYEGKTQRANFILWTNDASVARIDISAGFTTYANIYADVSMYNHLSIYLPTENTLLASNNVDYKNGFKVLDIDFPVSIHTLIDFIQGNFSYYFNDTYQKVFEEVGQNIFTYQVNVQSNNEFISLDENARLIKWTFYDWLLEFTYKDSHKPSKIYAKNNNGNSLTIYITNIQEKSLYPQSSFDIKLGDGIKFFSLDD